MNTLRFTIVICALLARLIHPADGFAVPLTGQAVMLDGSTVELDSFVGQAVLVVNVASRCGQTRQYRPLQDLYETYRDRGLVILGFPCNQFGRQEPGADAEILAFCQKNYGVTFPMFSKIDVNGPNAHPLYQHLTSDAIAVKDRGPVKWNFEKFLFNREGKVVARFRSRVRPDAPEVIQSIEAILDPTLR